GQVLKVCTASQQQRITDLFLQVPVWTLDDAILMRQAAIVAGRLHPITDAQGLVTRGEVFACMLVQITEGGREAVAPMLTRRPTQGSQRILQPFGERDITLATQSNVDVLKS